MALKVTTEIIVNEFIVRKTLIRALDCSLHSSYEMHYKMLGYIRTRILNSILTSVF